MNNNKTPLVNAKKRFKQLRWRWRSLPADERQEYFFARHNRNYTRYWERSGKNDFLERMDNSEREIRAWIEKWNGFLEWMDAHVRPNAEKFEAIRGLSVTGSTTTNNNVTFNNNERFKSDMRSFDSFYNRMKDYVDGVVEQLEDGENHFEDLIDEIQSVANSIGLEPHPEWNDGSDGAVWFQDPETGINYFTLLTLYNIGGRYSITSTVEPKHFKVRNWRKYNYADLAHTVIHMVDHYRMKDLTRPFRDYFGHFDHNLRPYMEAAESPPPFPWE